MIRLAIVDDHRLFREVFCLLVSRQKNVELVGASADLESALQVASERRPDVVLLDVHLERSLSLHAIGRFKAHGARVLVLTAEQDERMAVFAFACGADGYAVKHHPADELFRAIQLVGAGERYIAAGIPDDVIFRGRQASPLGPFAELTPRERQICGLVAGGASSAEIAEALSLSPRTVETHRAHINSKLGVTSPAELLRVMVRFGYDGGELEDGGGASRSA